MEIIERDEARRNADLIEMMALANTSGISKQANKAISDIIKKLRSMIFG